MKRLVKVPAGAFILNRNALRRVHIVYKRFIYNLIPFSSGGKNVEEIAKERNLAVSTIYTHLYHLIANYYLSSAGVVSEEKIKLIEEAYKKFSYEPKLKELKEMLPENISYEEIRCVTAHFNMSKIAKYILK